MQLHLSTAQPPPVTPAVIKQAQEFYSKYQLSLYPPGKTSLQGNPSVTIWWTPDPVNHQLQIAVMGIESGFVGFGFNNKTAGMLGGWGVVAHGDKLTLYQLQNYYPGPGGVQVYADQSNIKNGVYQLIDGYIFMEFTWLLKPPVYFSLDKLTNVIWSVSNFSGSVMGHDNAGYIANFNFSNPQQSVPGYVPGEVRSCGYGDTGNYIPFIGTSCVCPPSFTPESNCTVSSLKFNHTFMDGSTGQNIVTMYWTLNNSVLDVVVQRDIDPSGTSNQWAGIGFSNAAGQMGPTDAVIAPDTKGGVYPVFIAYQGGNGITTYSNVTITNSVFTVSGGSNFFSFQRKLTDGNNPITDPHNVPMIAAASEDIWNPPLQSFHKLFSYGPDILDLQNGNVFPSTSYLISYNLQDPN